MSVIVAVKKAGRVVLGADTAESEDDLVITSDYIVNSSKIVKAGDSWLGLAGWSATQHIIESVLRNRDHQLDFSNRSAIFETSRKLHEIMKSDYFMDTNEGGKLHGSEFNGSDAEGAPGPNGRIHAGYDHFAEENAPIRSPISGTIVEVRPSSGTSGQVFGGTV